MNIIPLLIKEMQNEAVITRKMLQRVPADKFTWKPHEKSMDMKTLSVHIAELPAWVHMALTTSVLDFAAMDYKPTPVETNEDLLKVFENSYTTGINSRHLIIVL